MTSPQSSFQPTYSFREFSDRRLRVKADTVDDPDWIQLVIDPNTLILTPGGVAEAATYTWQVTPTDTDNATPDPVTATGTAADNAATAVTFGAAIEAERLLTLADYVESVVVIGAAIQVRIKHNAPEFTEVSTPPGAATFESTPEDTWPITRTTSNQRGMRGMQPTQVAFSFVAVDGSGDPLPNDNVMTFTVQLVRLVERVFRNDSTNEPHRTPGISASRITTGQDLVEEYRADFHGGRFGLQITTIANTPTNYVALEVHVREVING